MCEERYDWSNAELTNVQIHVETEVILFLVFIISDSVCMYIVHYVPLIINTSGYEVQWDGCVLPCMSICTGKDIEHISLHFLLIIIKASDLHRVKRDIDPTHPSNIQLFCCWPLWLNRCIHIALPLKRSLLLQLMNILSFFCQYYFIKLVGFIKTNLTCWSLFVNNSSVYDC